MLVSSLIGFVRNANFEKSNRLADKADDLSSFWSTVVGVACISIVTFSIYGSKPIHCHAPITFGGTQFSDYITNYCYIEGSVAIPSKDVVDRFPQTEKEWKELEETGKLTYYQWIPLFLSAITIFPYILRALWTIFYSRNTGTDYQNILDMAFAAQTQSNEDRKKTVSNIANSIVDTLHVHREYRSGKLHNLKRRLFDKCNFGFFSKRFGSRVNFSYLMMKVFYLGMHIGILLAIHHFLGLGDDYRMFGVRLLREFMDGKSWKETGLFPRVTYCNVPIKHMRVNHVYAQCTLNINFLNESIFIFLWFWHIICFCTMAASLVLWILHTISRPNKARFIKKCLILSGSISYSTTPKDKKEIRVFSDNFLQNDGFFLVRMLDDKVGCAVSTQIMACLWDRFHCIKDWRDLPRPYYGPPKSICIGLEDRETGSLNGGSNHNTELLRRFAARNNDGQEDADKLYMEMEKL